MVCRRLRVPVPRGAARGLSACVAPSAGRAPTYEVTPSKGGVQDKRGAAIMGLAASSAWCTLRRPITGSTSSADGLR